MRFTNKANRDAYINSLKSPPSIVPNGDSLRPDWNVYFLNIARAVAERADCSRRKVGAVLVKDYRICSTGYNASWPGGPSCLKGECPRANSGVEPGSSYDTGAGACVNLHAEANSLLYTDRDRSEGSTLYCTEEPCDGCTRLIWGAGVTRVVTPRGEILSPAKSIGGS